MFVILAPLFLYINIRLLQLLERTFPLLEVPEVQIIPLKILEGLKQIPEEFVQHIAGSEAYHLSSVIVKRKVWIVDENKFLLEFEPVVSACLKQVKSFYKKIWIESGLAPKKRRRNSATLTTLRDMIGDSIPLYDKCVELLKKKYKETNDIGYCTLRTDLLMSLFDEGVKEVCNALFSD